MGVGTGLGWRRPGIAATAPVPRPFEHIIVEICLKSKISHIEIVAPGTEGGREWSYWDLSPPLDIHVFIINDFQIDFWH